MKADEMERRFDAGEDVSEFFDWSAAERPNLGTRRVAIDLPLSVIENLDRQAQTLGVTRQTLINRLLAERLG